MRRLLHFADKIALVACMILFLASAVWAAMSFRRIDAIAGLNSMSGIAPARYESTLAQMPTIAQVAWPQPPQQSRGEEWIYDVFTPPVLYYDQLANRFTVSPPDLNVAAVQTVETPFEVELLSVRQEPYRIQLHGYTGDASDYSALFEIVETGASVRGRPGVSFPENQGNFTVRSFEVRRVTTNSDGSMPVVDNVAFATILDGRTGREVTLTNRERLMLPRLQCVLRTRVYPPADHVLREGMSITVNGSDYLVAQLSLNPAQAVVSRRRPNDIGSSETRTLIPVGESAPFALGANASRPRDNSIDSLRVSLFSSTRHLP